MKDGVGTPSTLKKAIENGIDEFNTTDLSSHSELVEVVREHVEEFIRNKLNIITFSTDDEQVLKAVSKFVDSLG